MPPLHPPLLNDKCFFPPQKFSLQFFNMIWDQKKKKKFEYKNNCNMFGKVLPLGYEMLFDVDHCLYLHNNGNYS